MRKTNATYPRTRAPHAWNGGASLSTVRFAVLVGAAALLVTAAASPAAAGLSVASGSRAGRGRVAQGGIARPPPAAGVGSTPLDCRGLVAGDKPFVPNDAQLRAAFRFSRTVFEETARRDDRPELPIPPELAVPGPIVFATLYRGGERAGSISGHGATVGESIRDAVSRAARDARYQRVQAEEMPYLRIQLTFVQPRIPTNHRVEKPGETYAAGHDPRLEGLMFRVDRSESYFLPFVFTAETRTAEQWIARLAAKATGSSDAAKKPDACLFRVPVADYAEAKNGGDDGGYVRLYGTRELFDAPPAAVMFAAHKAAALRIIAEQRATADTGPRGPFVYGRSWGEGTDELVSSYDDYHHVLAMRAVGAAALDAVNDRNRLARAFLYLDSRRDPATGLVWGPVRAPEYYRADAERRPDLRATIEALEVQAAFARDEREREPMRRPLASVLARVGPDGVLDTTGTIPPRDGEISSLQARLAVALTRLCVLLQDRALRAWADKVTAPIAAAPVPAYPAGFDEIVALHEYGRAVRNDDLVRRAAEAARAAAAAYNAEMRGVTAPDEVGGVRRDGRPNPIVTYRWLDVWLTIDRKLLSEAQADDVGRAVLRAARYTLEQAFSQRTTFFIDIDTALNGALRARHDRFASRIDATAWGVLVFHRAAGLVESLARRFPDALKR